MQQEITQRRDLPQTSKDMGANVESDFERLCFLHTFALSKDGNNMYNN